MRVSTVNGGQSPSGDSSYGQWGPQILDGSKKTGIPPALLYQQMMAESSGNPNSLGDGGKSFGLMQIQQATWEDFQKNNRDKLPPELKNASWDQIKNDPRLNLLAGAALMKGYHDEWAAKGYSSDDAWKLALRQYNSGSVRIRIISAMPAARQLDTWTRFGEPMHRRPALRQITLLFLTIRISRSSAPACREVCATISIGYCAIVAIP